MGKQIGIEEGLYYRQTLFDQARRIVIKVGSAILTGEDGMNLLFVENLARGIAFLQDSGREVILVTSGAVSAGRRKINNNHENLTIKEKQALAAIGQSCLMNHYDIAFHGCGRNIGQILLTHSDLSSRKRYLNVRNTILTLFKFNVIPVINENDTVSTEELKFGDNDNLAALVANLIEADMFICLTDVDGLYEKDPHLYPEAKPIYTVSEVTKEIEAMAGNSKSALGAGGMQSKIRAAKMVSAGGGCSLIGPGRRKNILQHLFSGELAGTFFLPKKEKMRGRKRWIAYVLKPQGTLVLDAGACRAVSQNNKSLLPTGITDVEGEFSTGDAVVCMNSNHEKVAVGLTNFSSEELFKIKGLRSDKIEQVLGHKEADEVLHRDNLVVI